MPGAGLFPSGMRSYGYGTTPDDPTAQKLLLDENGVQHNCRYVDPVTGNYAFSVTNPGQLLGGTAAHQAVILASKTTRGRAAVLALGQGVIRRGPMDERWATQTVDDLRVAYKAAVDQGIVEILSIEATRVGKPGFGMVHVVFRDVETGQVGELDLG